MSEPAFSSTEHWCHDGVIDMLDQLMTCEHCGKERVRFIHLLSHPDHASIRVGYVCAAKLTGEETAREQEDSAKNKAARALRLMNHKNWVETEGESTLRVWNDRAVGCVRLTRDGLWWSWRVELSTRTVQSSRGAVNADDAKRDAIRSLMEVDDFRAD